MTQHGINTVAVIILIVSGAALKGQIMIAGLVLGSLLFAFSGALAKSLNKGAK